MILLFNILVLGGTGWWIVRHFCGKFGLIAIWGMLAKVLGAVCLGCIYYFYYKEGDTFDLLTYIRHFNEIAATGFSNYLSELFTPIDPHQGNPRTVFFVLLMSPLGVLSQNSYVLLTGYLCLFSYWTSWTFLAAVDRFYPKVRQLAIVTFCFLPTYLFWASGLLKDTLVNGALFYLIASLITFYHTKKLGGVQWLLTMLLFGCLFMSRHYVAGLFCIFALLLLADQWIARYGIKARIALFAGISILGAYGIRFFFIRLRPERFPTTFYELHEKYLAISSARSNISFDLQPTWSSLIGNLPKSLWAGLFRPGVWEARNLLLVLESLQTAVLLIGFVLSAFLIRKIKSFPSVVLAMILFVIVLATFLPMAAPNFGSLSRYRVAFTPSLAFLVMYLPFRQFVRRDL